MTPTLDSVLTSIRNGAPYTLRGLTLTINDIPMVLTDGEFDQVWDALDEIEGEDFMLSAAEGQA